MKMNTTQKHIDKFKVQKRKVKISDEMLMSNGSNPTNKTYNKLATKTSTSPMNKIKNLTMRQIKMWHWTKKNNQKSERCKMQKDQKTFWRRLVPLTMNKKKLPNTQSQQPKQKKKKKKTKGVRQIGVKLLL